MASHLISPAPVYYALNLTSEQSPLPAALAIFMLLHHASQAHLRALVWSCPPALLLPDVRVPLASTLYSTKTQIAKTPSVASLSEIDSASWTVWLSG